jgi:hypothetical protein
MNKKWKYPDPKISTNPKEKWYENIPDDEELENYIHALINRHSIEANSRGLSFQKDAALVPLLMKLVYSWKIRE